MHWRVQRATQGPAAVSMNNTTESTHSTQTTAAAITPPSRHLRAVGSAGFRVSRTLDRDDHDATVMRAVIAAKAGDMEAVRFLYIRYKDNVYGYVLSIVRESHEAEDVTQQVFMKLMSSIQKYEPRAVPFTAWILRVARNVAIDQLRRRRAIVCEEVFEPACATDDSGRDCRWDLESALGELPEDQREVVVLRHLVGLTPGEIAERLGRSESSIHGLHHRGRLALQRKLVELERAPTGRAA
jgi:RNA polymerase sigma-70 factor (ECF subfamily)